MSTKEEEATQEVAQEAGPGGRSEQNYGPPAYELHRYDTLYTNNIDFRPGKHNSANCTTVVDHGR